MVRALACHQCGPGTNPGFDTTCGLSPLFILSPAPRGFSLGTLVFPTPQKPTFPNSNLTRNQADKEHFVDVLPPNHYSSIYLSCNQAVYLETARVKGSCAREPQRILTLHFSGRLQGQETSTKHEWVSKLPPTRKVTCRVKRKNEGLYLSLSYQQAVRA